MRRKKGSNNRYKARKLLRKAYKKLTNRKQDKANKIVSKLLEHSKVYMHDENIKAWHKGKFGKTVQHSVLGLVKQKLMRDERVIVLSGEKNTCGTQEINTFGEDVRQLKSQDLNADLVELGSR